MVRRLKTAASAVAAALLSCMFIACSNDDDDDKSSPSYSSIYTSEAANSIANADGEVTVTPTDAAELPEIVRALATNEKARATLDFKGGGVLFAIERRQFENCIGLSGITFCEGLQEIPKEAFRGWINLKEVAIPASVTFIDGSAFSSCTALSGITVAENNKGNYSVKDHMLYQTKDDGLWLVCWPTAKDDITLPSDIIGTLSRVCYGNNEITAVTVPEGVEVLQKENFTSQKLTKLSLPASLKTYEQSISGCPALKNVTVADGNPVFTTDTSHKLLFYTVPETNVKCLYLYAGAAGEVTDIPDDVSILRGAFFNNRQITSVTLPKSVTDLSLNSFISCTKLASINLEDVTIIGKSAFQACTALTTVNLCKVTEVRGAAFWETNLTQVTLPATLTRIEYSAFMGCSSLQTVRLECEIPPQLTNADNDYATVPFEGCTALTKIEVPAASVAVYKNAPGWKDIAGVTFVGYNAEQTAISPILAATGDYTIRPTEITAEELAQLVAATAYNTNANFTLDLSNVSNMTELARYSFTSTGIKHLIVGGSITKIDFSIFRNGTDALQSIHIGKNVTDIHGNAFRGCTALTHVTVDADNEVFKAKDNMLFRVYDSYSAGLHNFFNATGAVSIPETITEEQRVVSVEYAAFYNCTGLTNARLPSSIYGIGNEAFSGCTKLATVNLDNVSEIGGQAFYGCTTLTDITLSSALTSMYYDSFKSCTSLKTVRIATTTPPVLKSKENTIVALFEGCTALTTIEVPATSVAAYKAAPGWSQLADKIVGY